MSACLRTCLVVLFSLAPVIAQAQAQAQTAPPSAPPAAPAADADARRHFMQAVALYNDANFEAALAEFLAAYKAKPSAFILYNIGLTYKALFLYNDAIRTLEQYLHDEAKITPERKAEVEQLLREMQALLAPISLAIAPDGAQVKVDGRTIGRAPIGQYLLAAGRHVIQVEAEGYTPQTKELMVTAGAPMAVAITLAVIPKTGRVRVAVEPTGSTIKVDGKVYPPPVDLELPLGGHTLEVWGTGYVTHREEVLVAAGQTRDISVTLRRPPISKRAAFIVPVTLGSIAVAGGIVLGIVCGAYGKCSPGDVINGTLYPYATAVGR